MNTNTIFITIASIISCLGFIVISAMFASHLRDLLAALFSMFLHPLQSISAWFQRAGAAFKSGALSELAQDRDGKSIIEPLLGAMLFSVFSVLFIYSDTMLIGMSFAALGHGEFSAEMMQQTPTVLLAMSFIANAGFWGLVFCDMIGLTHCGPWNRVKGFYRYALMTISIICMFVTIAIAMALGYVRVVSDAHAASAVTVEGAESGGLSITGQDAPAIPALTAEPDAPAALNAGPVALQDRIQTGCLTGIAALTILSTFFSMCGLFPMLKCLILIVSAGIVACIAPIAFGTWLLQEMLRWFYTTVQKALDLCVAVGTSLLSLVGWSPADSVEVPETQYVQDELEAAPSTLTGQGVAKDANQTATDFNPLGWEW
jgi:hypothetical protein